MGKIRLDLDDIKYINMFESMTGAKVMDCVHVENAMCFLVNEGEMGLAIGKGGVKIERIKNMVGKTVWVSEFSKDTAKFIKNLFQPVKIKKIIVETGKEPTAIIEIRRMDKRKVIGYDGSRIKIAKKFVKRHHNIEDIKINMI